MTDTTAIATTTKITKTPTTATTTTTMAFPGNQLNQLLACCNFDTWWKYYLREENLYCIIFQISGYEWHRINTWIDGTTLVAYRDLNKTITYCNSRSNCDGVWNDYCFNQTTMNNNWYYVVDGSCLGCGGTSSRIGTCAWVVPFNSKILLNIQKGYKVKSW